MAKIRLLGTGTQWINAYDLIIFLKDYRTKNDLNEDQIDILEDITVKIEDIVR